MESGIMSFGITDAPIADIIDEALRAHAKHGPNSMVHSGEDRALAIVVEEVGEVARELNEHRLGNRTHDEFRKNMRKELVQCGAMILTWLVRYED